MTAWVVSDSPPASATSAWPPVFLAIGMLYAGFVPALIRTNTHPVGPMRSLALAAAFHLAPVGAVTWFATAALAGSAYAHLSSWLWSAYVACVLLTLGMAAWLQLKRTPPA